MEMKTMELPARMIHQSFRYCLGRRSYSVGDWCDWFIKNHQDIPANEMAIIRRELSEAFQNDDEAREQNRSWRPLGEDCDLANWLKVLLLMGRE